MDTGAYTDDLCLPCETGVLGERIKTERSIFSYISPYNYLFSFLGFVLSDDHDDDGPYSERMLAIDLAAHSAATTAEMHIIPYKCQSSGGDVYCGASHKENDTVYHNGEVA